MTAQAPQKSEVKWNQAEFEVLKATWSPERLAEDEKLLEEIFRLAEESPTAKQALDWARQNGIQFFIDRTGAGFSGYYMWGTGVVGLAHDYAFPRQFPVEVITHEIRHAWQDYHGMIPCQGPVSAPAPGGFSEYFTKLALIEADAMAFGKKAGEEIREVQDDKFRRQQRLFNLFSLKDPKDTLRKSFLSWFAHFEGRAQFYGNYASKLYGQKWKVYDGELPERRFEFNIKKLPVTEGIDITDIENVLRLGRDFSGNGNYLTDLPKEVLLKKILPPSLADAFYGAAYGGQRKLTSDIRKAYLRDKLSKGKSKAKQPKTPLPA